MKVIIGVDVHNNQRKKKKKKHWGYYYYYSSKWVEAKYYPGESRV